MSQKIALALIAMTFMSVAPVAQAKSSQKQIICTEIANQVGSVTTQQRGAIEEGDQAGAAKLDAERHQLIALHKHNGCDPSELTELRQSLTCQDLERQLQTLAKGLVDADDAEVERLNTVMDPLRKKYAARCMKSRRG